MSFTFNEKNLKKCDAILKCYPNKQAALLPVLWLAQKQQGYLPLDAQEYVAQLLDLSPVHVYGVTTFYTMFKTKPVGKYHLQLCRTLSCALVGMENIGHHLKEKYQLEHDSVSKDGRFSLELVECLGSCGSGPALMVNDSLVEHLTIEKLDKLMEKLKKD
ncbi:MAG: NAD(P)H-dependent oxidoreductase subunit E [bacterium]|nr:NAD(P)H-dependent oxidoreductase subunit E [bacterium]MBU1916735.1 NAD(P)H-dependent oxidoreductase subunit E [bacterium]